MINVINRYIYFIIFTIQGTKCPVMVETRPQQS